MIFEWLNQYLPKKIDWHIIPEYQRNMLGKLFDNFDEAYAYEGEFITKSPLSQVYKVPVEGKNFYLKKYNVSRKKLQRYSGQSKIQTEWQNLLWFQSLDVPVAKVVAYGQETMGWITTRGILITEELVDTSDLANVADDYPQLLQQPKWVAQVSHQVARAARILHQHHFAHNDFKWRNIMVDIKADFPQIYLIDCPSGMKWFRPFLEYRIIKDLACLDKRAKYELSKTQRLAFYKDYAQCSKLSAKDKERIHKIIRFFHNRE